MESPARVIYLMRKGKADAIGICPILLGAQMQQAIYKPV